MDMDMVMAMVRSLLKERFKLAIHSEERPANAYSLLAVKPKMKTADPAGRTRVTAGPNRERNAPTGSRQVTVQNMSMDEFAEQLQRFAPGYIQSPVRNATGLEGRYDFTLTFSPAGAARGGGGGRGGKRGGPEAPSPSGVPGEASDPTGALTLPEAVDRQLGLKLEMQKRPVTVWVVDHVERRPTEN